LKLPACFYSKAFWVVVPLLSISMASSVMAISEQIQTNIQYDYSQDTRINDLTYDINGKLTKMEVNQMLICDKLQVNCK